MTNDFKWSLAGDNFYVTSSKYQVEKLPAGVYKTGTSMQGRFVSKMETQEEEVINFTSGPMSMALKEIEQFWTLKAKYGQLGLTHKRGILLYGPPGTGKTSILRAVTNSIIKSNGIVIYESSAERLQEFIPIFKELEKDRKLVVIFEDIDNITDNEGDESLLEVLDGMGDGKDGILFLATTNYIHSMPERLYRPSRFDLLIEVGYPTLDMRRIYITNLCKKFNIRVRNDIIRASAGMSFAHMKEMLIASILYGYDLKTIKQRLEKHSSLSDDDDDD